MRIIIAGPFPQKNSNGGVAVFDKNIAVELSKKMMYFGFQKVLFRLLRIQKFNTQIFLIFINYELSNPML